MDGAAAFGGRSPLGVAGLGGLTGGDAGTAGGGLLGGGPNGGLLNLLGLELPLSGTAAFGSDGLASDALAGAFSFGCFRFRHGCSFRLWRGYRCCGCCGAPRGSPYRRWWYLWSLMD